MSRLPAAALLVSLALSAAAGALACSDSSSPALSADGTWSASIPNLGSPNIARVRMTERAGGAISGAWGGASGAVGLGCPCRDTGSVSGTRSDRAVSLTFAVNGAGVLGVVTGTFTTDSRIDGTIAIGASSFPASLQR